MYGRGCERSQCTAMQSRRLLRLALGALAAGIAAAGSAQVAFADSAILILSASHGIATVSLTATYSYTSVTGQCPTSVFFYWDKINLTPNGVRAQGCIAQFTFKPASTNDANPRVTYQVCGQALSSQFPQLICKPYTIDGPLPPPRSPSPVPSARSTPIATHRPSASPTPAACYVEGHTLACPSPRTPSCTSPTVALPPSGTAGGVPPLVLAFMLAPFGAMLVFRPGLKNRRLSKASALLLLLVTTSCTSQTGKSPAVSPTPTASGAAIVGFESTPDCRGYWEVAADGGMFPLGHAGGFGSTGGVHLVKPIVDMEATPDGGGYWLVASDGGIFPFGDAAGFGSIGSIRLNKPVVAMENTPDGGGYWLVASDGGIFPFGDAVGYGSTGGIHINKPIVDVEATPDGAGYWLVASDGGILPFGDASGYGSTGSIRLNKPIVGMEATLDGAGYWLVASDGAIFPFGDAAGYGSTGSQGLKSPIVGMEASPDGSGYWLFAADGGVFPFGDAPGLGSAAH